MQNTFKNIKRYFILFIIFSTILEGCSNNKKHIIYTNQLQESVEKVDIDDLIQNPDTYKNRAIEITGIYRRNFEESVLYANSFNNRNKKKALWVSFDTEYYPLIDSASGVNLLSSYKTIDQIDGKKIKIRGKFNPLSKGHLEIYFATIEKVFYVEILN